MAGREVVIPYAPRPGQLAVHEGRGRWLGLVCHRRWGKTVWGINELVRGALTLPLLEPRLAYVAPFRNQAKAVAWSYLERFTAPLPGARALVSELRVVLPRKAEVRLFGADRPNALRGLYFDGIILDEFGDMDPALFEAVVGPALADRLGWAVFCGTPKGRNHFAGKVDELKRDMAAGCDETGVHVFKASQTGIIRPAELERLRRKMSPELFAQELECSFQGSVKGAYFGRLMEEADAAGRLCRVPVEPRFPVHTAWDLGVGDSTAIWFCQVLGAEVRLVDYYEAEGEGLAHYAKVLQQRGYLYGRHVAPHDIEVRELGSGRSRRELAADLGLKFDVCPAFPLEDGIEAARVLLPRCWFDLEKCQRGIEVLRNYRRAQGRKGDLMDRPLHDWSSHGADAFRYLALKLDALEVGRAGSRAPVRAKVHNPLW